MMFVEIRAIEDRHDHDKGLRTMGDCFVGLRFGPTDRFRSVPYRFLPLKTSGSPLLIAVIVMLISPLAMTTGDAESEPDAQKWVGGLQTMAE